MRNAHLGEKRRCLDCSTLFFDLNRTPIVCPKCKTAFTVVEVVRSSRNYPRAQSGAGLIDRVPTPAILLVNEEGEEGQIAPESDKETQETEVPT